MGDPHFGMEYVIFPSIEVFKMNSTMQIYKAQKAFEASIFTSLLS